MKTAKRSPAKAPVLPRAESNVLDAARAIFVADGLPGLSVRRVAELAGCTTMAVYTQFGGKPGIVASLYSEGFERLARAQASVDASLPPVERVRALCQAYRATAHAYPHHYALMLGSFSGEFTPTPSSASRALSTLETLVDATTAAVRSVHPSATEQHTRMEGKRLAHAVFALCHGWVSLELGGLLPRPSDPDGCGLDEAVRCHLAYLTSTR